MFAHTTCAGFAVAVLVGATSAFSAINGTALVIRNGHIFKYTMPGNTWDTCISTSDFSSYHSLSGPCFSPDGRQVAYSRFQLNTGAQDGGHILIADNDGNNITDLCQTYRGTAFGDIWCSWANNGYIYWSEDDDRVMRVSVATRTKEIVARLADFTGPKPAENRIDGLKVSRDATRAAFMIFGVGYCVSLDFTTMVARDYGSGCQGTVSPNGQLVTHSVFGGNYSYHQRGFIHDFTSQNVVDTFYAPGASANNCTSNCPRFVDIRFSHSSDTTIVFSGEDGLGGNGYVHNLRSGETVLLGQCAPKDFWCGTLPPPPAAAARIALDSATLSFASVNGSIPAAKVVRVSNSGIGTLTNVAFTGNPAWLTVTRGGSGNAQTLTNAVNPVGLTAGVHTATITVSGGGATNTVNYTVTFNVARSVLAPSNLVVAGQAVRTALLTWTDNANNETAVLVERKAGTAAWTRRTTLAANAVTWNDTGLAELTMYRYRLRACNATDTSGYSNEDSVQFQPVRSVTVTSPSLGAACTTGSTVRIRWTTQNVTKVDIFYTIDGGDQWLLIGNGSVENTSPNWANYPWVVPALTADSLMIRVQEYSNPAVSFTTPGIAVVRSAGAASRVSMMRGATGLSAIRLLASGDLAIDASLRSDGVLSVVRADGVQVYQQSVSGMCRAQVPSPASGAYIVRLQAGSMVQTRQVVVNR